MYYTPMFEKYHKGTTMVALESAPLGPYVVLGVPPRTDFQPPRDFKGRPLSSYKLIFFIFFKVS